MPLAPFFFTQPGTLMPFTTEEREQMLASVESMVKAAGVRLQRELRPMFANEDREDFEQDVRLALWKLTEQFDPARGTKWSSYAFPAVERLRMTAFAVAKSNPEIQPDEEAFAALAESPDREEHAPRDTATELHDAVRRQLAAGILDQIGPGYRRLIERVVFEGLTSAQIAEQDGHPVKAVKANLKAALRALCEKGLIDHAATAGQVAAATAPVNTRKPDWSVIFRRKLDRAAAAPCYAERLGRVEPDLAAVLELIRADGIGVNVAAELLGKCRRGAQSVLTRAFHTVAV